MIEVGGPNGDPFDRTPVKLICLTCGRASDTVITDQKIEYKPRELSVYELAQIKLNSKPIIKRVIVLEMCAQAMNVVRRTSFTVPYSDGSYSLSDREYPLSRFGTFRVEGDVVSLDGESAKLTREGVKMQKQYSACDFSGHYWPETVDITIREAFVRPDKETDE